MSKWLWPVNTHLGKEKSEREITFIYIDSIFYSSAPLKHDKPFWANRRNFSESYTMWHFEGLTFTPNDYNRL